MIEMLGGNTLRPGRVDMYLLWPVFFSVAVASTVAIVFWFRKRQVARESAIPYTIQWTECRT